VDCTDAGGNHYAVVHIGNQTWMAENLRYLPENSNLSNYTSTIPISNVYGYYGTNIDTAKASENYRSYGVLYNWLAAKAYCPEGWHLPTKTEWNLLISNLGGSGLAGSKLKETGISHWKSLVQEATNESGFTGIPGGSRVYGNGINGIFNRFEKGEEGAFWWCSDTGGWYSNPIQYNINGTNNCDNYPVSSSDGYSVRYIRNCIPSDPPAYIEGDTLVTAFKTNVTYKAAPVEGALYYRWIVPNGANIVSGQGTSTLKVNMGSEDGEIKVSVRNSCNYSTYNTKKITIDKTCKCGTFTDTRDGNVYKWVRIGRQVWMAENLRYLPDVVPPDSGSFTKPYCYVYNYKGKDINAAKNTSNYKTYGVLYNWAAAQKYCPQGWHLPTDVEWKQLVDFLGGQNIAGGKLKSPGEDLWSWPNKTIENEFGFNALPGGYGGGIPYSTINKNGYWWGAFENGNIAFLGKIVNRENTFYGIYDTKIQGLSVRYVSDYQFSAPDSISGDSIVFDDSTNVVYSIGAVKDAESYHWIVPVASQIVAGQGTSSITVKFGKLSFGNEIKVCCINGCDSSNYTTKKIVIKNKIDELCGTSGTFTDHRDGNVYKWVRIGSQVWMAENLKYLTEINDFSRDYSNTKPKYYVKNYGINIYALDSWAGNSDNLRLAEVKTKTEYKTYGVMYNWPAAKISSPAGWHLPTDAEWKLLTDFLGGVDVAAGKLKEIGTAHWISPNTGATNVTGFTALPIGTPLSSNDTGYYGSWWSSTESPDDIYYENWSLDYYAWNRTMFNNFNSVNRSLEARKMPFPVRCVLDSHIPAPGFIQGDSIVINNSTNSVYTITPVEGAISYQWKVPMDAIIVTGQGSTSITVNFGVQSGLIAVCAINSCDSSDYAVKTIKAIPENFSGRKGEFVDYRDGNKYKWVKIGKQTWMAENLRYLPEVEGHDSVSTDKPCYYVYGFDGSALNAAKETDTYLTSGVLYNWPAAHSSSPHGWHLPNNKEWDELTEFLGGKTLAGGKLKETGTLHWNSPNAEATNETGFSALPGGSIDHLFKNYGTIGNWWSETEFNDSTAKSHLIGYSDGEILSTSFNKNQGLSVRCIRDTCEKPATPTVIFGDSVVIINSEHVIYSVKPVQTANSYHWIVPTGFDIISGQGTVSISVNAGIQSGEIKVCVINNCDSSLYAVKNIDIKTSKEFFSAKSGTFTDYRDGNIYKWVRIGSQIWMAENFRYLPKIEPLKDIYDLNNLPEFQILGYNGSDVNVAKSTEYYHTYGVLYNQAAAFNHAPDGWHLPSIKEWSELAGYLGGEATAGGKLKEAGIIHWAVPNTSATNETGFTALPGSYSYQPIILGKKGYWWSSSYSYSHLDRHLYKYVNINNDGSEINDYSSMESTTNLSVRYCNDICFGPDVPAAIIGDSIVTVNVPEEYRINPVYGAKTYHWIVPEGAYIVSGQGTSTISVTFGMQAGEVKVCAINECDSSTYSVKKIVKVNSSVFSGQYGSFTDSRDGQVYKTVNIGNQTWMAENLRYLPELTDTIVVLTPCYYVYGYKGTDVEKAKMTDNFNTYGVLYNWPAANVASPVGWHLPSYTEWAVLTNYLGGEKLAGGKLKETGFQHWKSPNAGTDNASGFSAQPGGYLRAGVFSFINNEGNWWTSTEGWHECSYSMKLYNTYGGSSMSSVNKNFDGLSIRCIKNTCIKNLSSPVSIEGDTLIFEYAIQKQFSTTNVIGASAYHWIIPAGATIVSGQGTNSITVNFGNKGGSIGVCALNDCDSSLYIYKTVLIKIKNPDDFTVYDNLFTDLRDGNIYKTVKIGNQIWMAENLRYLPEVTNLKTGSLTTPYCYVYGYDSTVVNAAKATENYKNYGVLYNWAAANLYCPHGWHLPNVNEWKELTDFLGNDTIAGGKLKEKYSDHWEVPNEAATNEFGFTAIPGGLRTRSGAYYNAGTIAAWWSSTEHIHGNSWIWYIRNNMGNLISFNDSREIGLSVRCIKDTCNSKVIHRITCIGDSVVSSHAKSKFYQTSDFPGAISYYWEVPAGASIISGQGTNKIEVDFGEQGGRIISKAVNACGDSIEFASIKISIKVDVTFTDSRDGNVYKIVTIGNQTWMAENLRYLPSVTYPENGSNALPCYYVYGYYGNDAAEARTIQNYENYGVLYNQAAAMNSCPSGWHLPSDAEWIELSSFLGVENDIAGYLKESGISLWRGTNTEATNSSGFTALPGGFRNISGRFEGFNECSYWRSNTQFDTKNSWSSTISDFDNHFNRFTNRNELGFSVRCVKNTCQPVSPPDFISGDSVVIDSAINVAYSTNNIEGATSYNWIVPEGASIVTGQGTNSISVNFGTQGGDVKVCAVNTCDSSAYTVKTVRVETNDTISQPGESGLFTDTRDGTVYKTITIGNQTWMAENLRYLPTVSGPATGSLTEPANYVYGYNGSDVAEAKATENYRTYGVLYNKKAAETSCPAGWHLPTDAEWKQLSDYLGGDNLASGKLRAEGTSSWADPNTDATNKSGFTALPGGYRSYDGAFGELNTSAYWWTATTDDSDPTFSFSRSVVNYINYFYRFTNKNQFGFSVRCVKDNCKTIDAPEAISGEPVVFTNTSNLVYKTDHIDGAVVYHWEVPEGATIVSGQNTDSITVNFGSQSGEIKVCAVNACGTSTEYTSSYITVTKGGTFTDTRDGTVYKTVTIGNHTWMAENLRYLPQVVGPSSISHIDPYNYVYGYDGLNVDEAKATDNYKTYGVLYNWESAKQNCPAGWHLPTDDEWTLLTEYLGGESMAAAKLKEQGTTHWEATTNDITNVTGFSAIPGGGLFNNAGFAEKGINGNWWTATESDFHVMSKIWTRLMSSFTGTNVSRDSFWDRNNAFSVRCVLDY
jgi:uncharacterized protein (TIGR02145 family)